DLLRVGRLDMLYRTLHWNDEGPDEGPRRKGHSADEPVVRRGLLHRRSLGRRADRGREPVLRPRHLHEADRPLQVEGGLRARAVSLVLSPPEQPARNQSWRAFVRTDTAARCATCA